MDVFAINFENNRVEAPQHDSARQPVRQNQAETQAANNRAKTQAETQESTKIDRAELEAAAKELSSRFDVNVEMAQDESTGRYVVRILSQDGKRVLRQMPPESALRMAARARQGQLRSIMESVA